MSKKKHWARLEMTITTYVPLRARDEEEAVIELEERSDELKDVLEATMLPDGWAAIETLVDEENGHLEGDIAHELVERGLLQAP